MAKKSKSDNSNGNKTTSDDQRQASLLARMMELQMRGTTTASFKRLSKDLNFMERTKTWRASWSNMFDQGYIESASGDKTAVSYTTEYRMTEAGLERVATPEFQEYQREIAQPAQTEEEHEARIKKKLLNKHGIQIFDLLLQHGSLTRCELAALIGINDRSHSFSYALKQIKHLNFVEIDATGGNGKKLRLSDESFLDPTSRPQPVAVDLDEIHKLMEGKNGKSKKNTEGGKKKENEAHDLDSAGQEDGEKNNPQKAGGKRKKEKIEDTDSGIDDTENKEGEGKIKELKMEEAVVKEEPAPDGHLSPCVLNTIQLETQA